MERKIHAFGRSLPALGLMSVAAATTGLVAAMWDGPEGRLEKELAETPRIRGPPSQLSQDGFIIDVDGRQFKIVHDYITSLVIRYRANKSGTNKYFGFSRDDLRNASQALYKEATDGDNQPVTVYASNGVDSEPILGTFVKVEGNVYPYYIF